MYGHSLWGPQYVLATAYYDGTVIHLNISIFLPHLASPSRKQEACHKGDTDDAGRKMWETSCLVMININNRHGCWILCRGYVHSPTTAITCRYTFTDKNELQCTVMYACTIQFGLQTLIWHIQAVFGTKCNAMYLMALMNLLGIDDDIDKSKLRWRTQLSDYSWSKLLLTTHICDKLVCGMETNGSTAIYFILLRYIAECGLSGSNRQENNLKIWMVALDPKPCSLAPINLLYSHSAKTAHHHWNASLHAADTQMTIVSLYRLTIDEAKEFCSSEHCNDRMQTWRINHFYGNWLETVTIRGYYQLRTRRTLALFNNVPLKTIIMFHWEPERHYCCRHFTVIVPFWFSTPLKTLFNIVEARFKKLLNYDVCVVWCSEGSINSQEYKSFEIYAVTIKISMTEY